MIRTAGQARKRQKAQDRAGQPTRVAIYCRKSTSHGLDQQFTSIQAQREAIEGYITSKRADGWVAVPKAFDDGGYSGANTDRPAFRQLMADVEAGEIDVVAVYKIDRLSRSQLDFMQVIDTFDRHDVAFVSVTESFDTSNPVGRLVLSILAVFAQFERERIAERTRDKRRAATAKGLWTGGVPLLGYDLVNKKLIINKAEAKRVREIFQLYLDLGSQMAVIAELERRGWKTKTYKQMNGKMRPGKPWTRAALQKFLRRETYLGKIESRGQVFDGQHEAIIDQETWDKVQALIRRNTRNGGSFTRQKPPTNLLTGLLHCGVCGSRMTHEVARSGDPQRRYSFYKCGSHGRAGSRACPGSRASTGDLDQFVIDRIREIGKDPTVLLQATETAREEAAGRQGAINDELKRLGQERQRLLDRQTRIVNAIGDGEDSKALTDELRGIEKMVAKVDAEVARVRDDAAAVTDATVSEADVRDALADFDGVWMELTPDERRRIVHLLIERIDADIPGGNVDVTYRSGGLLALAKERVGR